MSFVQKAAMNTMMCASIFAATALSAVAQNPTTPPDKKTQSNEFLRNTEFMFLARSFHTDRCTPFNENNFGFFTKHKVGGSGKYESAVMQGAYYNSNYTITPTVGSLNEMTVGRFKFGLLAGIALYPHVEKDVVKYNVVYSVDMPKNQKKRGSSKTYIPTGRPYEYTEIDKTYKARGLKNKFRLIPALLATFSYNAYKGSGPFATATYVPWKSGESKGLGIFAFGARINPWPEPRP